MTAQEARNKLFLVPSDMPVFVLLGSDPFAPGVVYVWAADASIGGVSSDKINQAIDVAESMKAYEPKKKPD